MKLTKQTLKRIIKEELNAVLLEGTDVGMLHRMLDVVFSQENLNQVAVMLDSLDISFEDFVSSPLATPLLKFDKMAHEIMQMGTERIDFSDEGGFRTTAKPFCDRVNRMKKIFDSHGNQMVDFDKTYHHRFDELFKNFPTVVSGCQRGKPSAVVSKIDGFIDFLEYCLDYSEVFGPLQLLRDAMEN
jgi:hypothetical protein